MSGAIQLAAPDPGWAGAAAIETRVITGALTGLEVRLHHIGSTAIPGLMAKPILDLLLETPDLAALAARSADLDALGYEVMGAFGIAGRLYFRKTDASGRRTHHLHAFATGSDHALRHLAFRDYLRAHPRSAAAYGRLKRALVARSSDPERYMDGKDAFVKRTEAEALRWVRARAC